MPQNNPFHFDKPGTSSSSHPCKILHSKLQPPRSEKQHPPRSLKQQPPLLEKQQPPVSLKQQPPISLKQHPPRVLKQQPGSFSSAASCSGFICHPECFHWR
ncbi:hypothetical protein VTH06DRAFT_1800 [Thermothelomyces fergusii]